MFINPFLFHTDHEEETIIISLIGGGIQTIPTNISKTLFSEPSLLSSDYIRHFKNAEILFDDSESFYSVFNDLKSKSFEKTLENPLNVIFTLTYSCNFKCEYCFQIRQNNNQSNRIIDENLINRSQEIVNRLEAINNHPKGKSNIHLYGGEPLRKTPALKRIVEKLIATFSPSNEIFITTNGYDLNHYTSILEKYSKLNIQVTIDGPKSIQNKRRKALDNGSSFDRILSNLRRIKDLNHNIMIRINVDEENYLFIKDLIYQLQESNVFQANELFDHIYLAPVTNRESAEVNLKFYKAFIDYYFKYLFQHKVIVSNMRALDYAIKLTQGETISPSKFYCDAIYGKYIIDPNGQIGICEEAVLNNHQIIGNIKPDGELNIKSNPWGDRLVDNIENCINCEFKYICSGGCPWKALNCTKDFMNSTCDGFKDIFEYSVKKILENELL